MFVFVIYFILYECIFEENVHYIALLSFKIYRHCSHRKHKGKTPYFGTSVKSLNYVMIFCIKKLWNAGSLP